MNACCGVLFFIVIGYGVIQLLKSYLEEKEKAQQQRQAKIEEYKAHISRLERSITGEEKDLVDEILYYFVHSFISFPTTSERIWEKVNRIQSLLSQLNQENQELIALSPQDGENATISRMESSFKEIQSIVNSFAHLGRQIKNLPVSYMLEENNYGQINKKYWNSIHLMNSEDILKLLFNIEKEVNNLPSSVESADKKNKINQFIHDPSALYQISKIDPKEVMNCIWFFSTEKQFSASNFQKARNLFEKIYHTQSLDITLAEFYAQKKIGGEEVLQGKVKEIIKNEKDARFLSLLASGLMWMNAHKNERAVLEYMVTNHIEMTPKLQERLHSLSTMGNRSLHDFDVQSSSKVIYFDVSSLTWKAEDYVKFFENIAFQNKKLSYSLAVREETKDLFISKGIKMPNQSTILDKFKSEFEEEYGSMVTAQPVHCVALSGTTEEKLNGIMVNVIECKQMNIFVHMAKIGKKLIIKFYTLYTPQGESLEIQKQQALSLYEELSPTVKMWESSLKDTILMSIEQLLNTTNSSSSINLSNQILQEEKNLESVSVESEASEPIF